MDIAAICLVLTALLAYANHRFIGLPTVIGVMSMALLISFALVGLDALGFGAFREFELPLLKSINFSDVLMQGMLSLMLFAGALHVDVSELRAHRWSVGMLALVGTPFSAILIAVSIYYMLPMFDMRLSFGYCLAFGALISPTDPIAVIGILKSARAPRGLSAVITGESLFNDGVGVVLFVSIESMLRSGVPPTIDRALHLFAMEAGGGVLYGMVLGWLTFRLLKSIDSYQEEVLLTLAAVVGGYALASHLHVSGPLAMVVVGLFIGNHGRALAMSDTTRKYIDMFWDLLDAILNSVLFVLIGLEVILIRFSIAGLLPMVFVICITLLTRLLTVAAPAVLLAGVINLPKGSWQVLTWGGLRGGISVALALSLPLGNSRDIVLALTYGVVIFSILVQGLTIGMVTKRALAPRLHA